MLKILLYPFALLYGVVVWFRNFLFDTKILHTSRYNTPVISVGNLTAGGTGKTPHAEYLIELLHKEFRIAYLSRGYKRKTKGFILAETQSTYLEIGDEAMQIKQKFPDITVAVCEKRGKGINELTNNNNINFDVIILDDAFQHRSVEPHINILLVDYTRPIFNDCLLPAGRLREPVRNRFRANIIIYTKCPSELKPIEQRIIKNRLNIRPYQDLFFTHIRYGEITPAEKGLSLFDDNMRNYAVLLITGIANPIPLIGYLEKQVGTIFHEKYPDHYSYQKADIDKFQEKYDAIETNRKLIITTEKDLVRLKSVQGAHDGFFRNVYYIPIEIKFLERSREIFNYRVLNYVRENKSNNRFHQGKNRV